VFDVPRDHYPAEYLVRLEGHFPFRLGTAELTTVGNRRRLGRLYRHSQLDRVVRRMNQILLRPEIPFRRLD
jgi:hypothetical protein